LRVVVLGVGAVGSRAARQLASTPEVHGILVADARRERAESVRASLGAVARSTSVDFDLSGNDVVVLAGPGHVQPAQAETALAAGAHVVATAHDLPSVRGLLTLDSMARGRGLTLAVGAGFSPGLSCLLAAHGAALFDEVREVHISHHGTGGPSCARAHHASLRRKAIDFRDGDWVERQGGSGRELVWFPEPVAGRDCYRAELADAVLLAPRFPMLERATSRLSATRRDRLTARLPMLRQPHPEGLVGALRVELRGLRNGSSETLVYGAMDRPAVAAGAVAAVVAVAAVSGELATGAGGLASLVDDPVRVLTELSTRGVRGAVFEGGPS
jgi:saccharopine dehydrogenase-like NADP-dependent oxidoreductase